MPTQATDQSWLDPAEAADIARFQDPATIRYYCRTGHLRATKIGRVWRIARKDLDAFLAGAPTEDLEGQAAVERWLAAAPPLSEEQKDVIAAAFGGDDAL